MVTPRVNRRAGRRRFLVLQLYRYRIVKETSRLEWFQVATDTLDDATPGKDSTFSRPAEHPLRTSAEPPALPALWGESARAGSFPYLGPAGRFFVVLTSELD